MSLKDALQQYVDKKKTAIQLIGDMTAMINPDVAVDLLAIINQITRLEQGKMDMVTFKQMWELK